MAGAMYEAGYGSSSRLYERAPTQLGMTPAEYRRGGKGITMNYTLVNSPLGRLLVAGTEKGISAVRLGDSWYGDGGVRLSAPLAPALRLGATRILAISPRYEGSHEEADRPQICGYPPAAQILSHLLDAIFLDVLDEDVRRLEGMNQLISKLPPEERGDYRPVDILVLRPSVDLGKLAMDYEPHLPDTFRLLGRSLGTGEVTTSDFLSMLMFQPDYLGCLMDIGEADAEARIGEIGKLLGLAPGGEE